MYEQHSLPDQLRMITVEHERHAPQLAAAAQMWTDAREWVEHQHEALTTYVTQLRETWRDDAGALFEERVRMSAATLWSWSGPPRNNLITFAPELFGSISTSGVADRLRELATSIGRTYTSVKHIHDSWATLPEHLKILFEPQARRNAGQAMDALAAQYGTATRAVETAVGLAWDGPRDAAPVRGQGSPGPSSPSSSPASSSPASTSAEPSSPASVPEPTTPTTPTTPSTSEPATLSDAAEALSALSDAAQSLLGSGSGMSVPEPVAFDPTVPVGDPLSPVGSMGGLNLAGLDPASVGGVGGAGGGVGVTGGSTAVPPVTTPSPAPSSGAMPVASARTGGGGASGGASGSPMYPPTVPPQSPNSRNGGVRPGTAEDPTDNGQTRARRRDVTPGVALRGRTGTAPLPVSRPRRDTGPQHLLDEELWQVDHEDHEPDHRAGRRGGAV